ncbi:SDR family NAD(P)-dependent oxidoreductase [Anaerobium acetethylicum]|uniref:Short-chain dehydrogenase n=1 Tax=Anaerobium acetethylicum TaxID=1619234 RepID=A0A1D3TST5_9FIRM|nr:SDR family NAD(P)-dependent oxidoreductase [Anaerobium acetethylicum]SCP96977.1 Short-chain dehydrogenase [Anaerobium acetethylicum]
MELNNKVVVVTGGGNGVGRELVLALLNKGAKVAALDVNVEGLNTTFALSGKNKSMSIHQTDISSEENVIQVVDEIKAYHGCVDVVINNAGIIQPFIPVSEIDMDIVQKVMQVSMGGFFPFPGQSIYGASKAAVKLLTEALYAELSGTSIGVTSVIPGGIATNILNNSNITTESNNMSAKGTSLLLTPKNAADLIIAGIEKDKFRIFIGKDANLLNIMYKFSPKFAIRLLGKYMSIQ